MNAKQLGEHRRAVTSLIWVARRYLEFASAALSVTDTFGEFHERIVTGQIPRGNDLLFCSADMTSAAIRLVTAEVTLDKVKGRPRSRYKDYQRLAPPSKGATMAGWEQALESRWPEFIHYMLRDDIGHEETPEPNQDDPEEVARHKRLEQLKRLTWQGTCVALKAILKRIEVEAESESLFKPDRQV